MTKTDQRLLPWPQKISEQQIMSTERVTISDLMVDLRRRRVTRDGDDLDVRGLTFDLLAALIRRDGGRATLQDLVDDVWRGEPVSNEVVTQRVRLLRRALDDDPSNPRYIKTIRQQGYELCVPAVAARATQPPTQEAGGWSRRGRALALVVVALSVLGAFLFLWSNQGTVTTDPLLERARTYAGTGQGDDNLRAIDLFEQVLASSPDNYAASLGLSFAYSQRVCRHDRNPEYVARARTLAERLLAANASDAEAISALAYAEDCAGDLKAALAGYLRAYELDATQLDALSSAAHLLQVKGELAAALENGIFVERKVGSRAFRYIDIQIARCLELMTFDEAAGARYARTVMLHPDNLFAAAANVRFLMSRGRRDEAREAATRSVRLGAASADLLILQGELAFLDGDSAAVAEALERAIAATQTNTWPHIARAILVPGAVSAEQMEKYRSELLAEMNADSGWPIVALNLAALHAHLGQTQSALTTLGKAVDMGFRDAAHLEASPLYAALRLVAGYDAELRRMRSLASAQRDRALAARWWSPALIDPDAL